MMPATATVLLLLATSAIVQAEWWNSDILYQVYPRSFADSDGDGNGDIRGILQHVDYLKSIGVGIVWLTPIYPSPLKDQGYDISDYKNVHPNFGTLQDVKDLINALHARGMRYIMDFVPNHSSEEHEWFKASKTGKGKYRDFYIWKDPKGWDSNGKPIPPNNWMSELQQLESAWTFDDTRKQFYLHHFGPYQPDFNYSNPNLVEALKDVMRFWFDLGVDGLRVDAVPYLCEDPEWRDEPVKPNCDIKTIGKQCLENVHTQNQPGTYEAMKKFDKMMQKEYKDKVLFLETYARRDQIMKYYQPRSMPFNFMMVGDATIDTNAKTLRSMVDSYMNDLPKDTRWPNWQTGNHDNKRVLTRFGKEIGDAMNMFVLLLPGVSVTYNGEEIGMSDPYLRSDQMVDSLFRERNRTPMQWNDSINAGFSTANQTWVPVNPDYWEINVKSESKQDNSHLAIYKQLSKYRKNFIGSMNLTTATYGDWIFAFKRTKGKKVCYVVINLNNKGEDIVLSKLFPGLPASLKIIIQSRNSGFDLKKKASTRTNIFLRPRSGIVLEP